MFQKMLSLTEGRKHIFRLAQEVQTPGTYYVFTEKGTPKSVLMSFAEFESLLETIEVMGAFPRLKEDVAQEDSDAYMDLQVFMEQEMFVSDNKASYGAKSPTVKRRTKSTQKKPKTR